MRLVIAQSPIGEGRDHPRNAVVGAVERGGHRPRGQPLDIAGIALVVIAVGRLDVAAGQERGQGLPVDADLHSAMDRARDVGGVGQQIDARRLADLFVAEPLIIAGHFGLESVAERQLCADVDAGAGLRLEVDIVAGDARRRHEQLPRLRDTVGRADTGVEPQGGKRLPHQRRLRRDIVEIANRRDVVKRRIGTDGIGVVGLAHVDLRMLITNAKDELQILGQRQFLAGANPHIAHTTEHRLRGCANAVATRGRLVERVILPVEIVVEDPDKAQRIHAQYLAVRGDVGAQIVAVERAAKRRGAGRLKHHTAVESRLRAPGRASGKVMLIARTDNGPAVVAREIALARRLGDARAVDAICQHRDRAAACGGSGCLIASLLVRIGEILVERQPRREAEFAFIVNHLAGDAVAVRQGKGRQCVDRAGLIAGMAGRTIGAGEAAEHRIFIAGPGMAERGVRVEIAIAAAIDSGLDALQVASTPRAEVDRPFDGIIAIARRGRAAHDVDRAISMRVGQIEPGKAVGLGDGKIILEHLDIARAEAVARVRAADRDSHIAWAIAANDGDAGGEFDDVGDGRGGRIAERGVGDGGVGLARDLGRQRQRAPGDDDVVGGCRCGARSIRLAFRGLCGRVEALQFGVDRRALAQQFLASRVGAGLSGRRRSGKRGDRRREKR